MYNTHLKGNMSINLDGALHIFSQKYPKHKRVFRVIDVPEHVSWKACHNLEPC